MKKVVVLVQSFVILLIFASFAAAAETDVDRLLNLLVDKGVLTGEDAAGFRADLAIVKQDEAAARKEFQITAGKQLKFSGYTQARYQSLNKSGDIDGFDIRRARLDIRGVLTPVYDYRAQIEFGGTKGPFLLDATVVAKFSPGFNVTLGQFKVPLSRENLTSSPKLETINRSQGVEALTARGKDVIGNHNGRDIGIAISGGLLPNEDVYLLDYTAGLFNGSGINAADKNEQKDFAARLVYHPNRKFDIGGSYYNGRGTWGTTSANRNRDRIGVDLDYHLDPVSIKGEYISGKDDTTRKTGWFLQAGYFFKPQKLQGVLKFDTYDADTKISANETNVYTFGITRFFNKSAFLQVNYELKREKGTEIDNNTLLSQFTFQF